MDIKIIFEDEEVLAINKPAGLLVHDDGVSKDETLVDWIVNNHPYIKGVGEEQKLKDGSIIERPGIVHRLDRDTSGVMLVAKTQESFLNLKSQFQDHKIKKAYLAIVDGIFKEDKMSGVIDKSIGRSPSDFRRWSAQPGARGQMREAQTKYHVLEQVEKNTLVFLEPRTGRTHQLRVHMKAIHHPIIGDGLYGAKIGSKEIDRQALHARSIVWNSHSGVKNQSIAPISDDFISALQELGFKYKPEV